MKRVLLLSKHLYLGFYNHWVPTTKRTRLGTEQLPWTNPSNVGLRMPRGTVALRRSWGLGQLSSRFPRHATQGKYFGGLTRRSQEPRGVHLQ
jgi:hypothetical protein